MSFCAVGALLQVVGMREDRNIRLLKFISHLGYEFVGGKEELNGKKE